MPMLMRTGCSWCENMQQFFQCWRDILQNLILLLLISAFWWPSKVMDLSIRWELNSKEFHQPETKIRMRQSIGNFFWLQVCFLSKSNMDYKDRTTQTNYLKYWPVGAVLTAIVCWENSLSLPTILHLGTLTWHIWLGWTLEYSKNGAFTSPAGVQSTEQTVWLRYCLEHVMSILNWIIIL